MSTPSAPYYQFGSGFIFVTPNAGNLAANPTPLLLGTIQDASVEFSQKLEELRGNHKFPDDVAPGDMDVKGKISIGRLNIELFNQIFFADTITAGIETIQVQEADTVPATSTYTITVTNSGTFTQDLGVQYASSGQPLVAVASGPTVGEYSVNPSTGIYTFAAADASAAVLISYGYASSSTGTTLNVTNDAQGYGPQVQLILDQPYKGKNAILLYAVRFGSLKQPLKRSGYSIVEMDYTGYCNPAGQVAAWFQGVTG